MTDSALSVGPQADLFVSFGKKTTHCSLVQGVKEDHWTTY